MSYFIKFKLKNVESWLTIIEAIKKLVNNSVTFTIKLVNEIDYDFISWNNIYLFVKKFLDKFNFDLNKIANNIIMRQIITKKTYDKKHESMSFKVKNQALSRFLNKYHILLIVILKSKLL